MQRAAFAVADTLDLAGTTSGNLSGLGSQFQGFTTVRVDAGADWTLTGANAVGGALDVAGTLTETAGSLGVARSLIDTGIIRLGGNAVGSFSGPVSGAGRIVVARGSQVEFGAAVMAASVSLRGLRDTVRIDDASVFAGRVSGFVASDTIVIAGGTSFGAPIAIDAGAIVQVAGGQVTVAKVAATGGDVFTVSGGATASVVAGLGNARVFAGGSDVTVALAGGGNLVTSTTGNVTVRGSASDSTVRLGSGSNSVTLSGTNDVVTTGAGNDIVPITGSLATVGLGTGSDMLTVSGDGPTVSKHGKMPAAGYAGGS